MKQQRILIDFLRPRQGNRRTRRMLALPVLVAFLVATCAQPFFIQPASAFSNAWTFTTPSDFVYDSTKIQVTGGQAELGRSPAWWDANYAYRQKITVTANASNDITTSNTITVNKDIAALVTAAKMQADHDDLRIVYWNGSTNTEIDRDYLATELGTSPTLNTVRFKAQAAISASLSDAGYYLYYGNGSAATPPVNPDNIYVYNEDFSSDPSWSTNNGSCNATTEVSSGRLRKTGTTTTTDCFRYDSVNTFDTTKNWYEEMTVRRNGGNLVSIGLRDWVGPTLGGWWFQSDDFNDIVKIWSSSGGLQNHSAFAQTNGVDYRYTMQFERLANWEPTCSGDTGWARLSGYINGTRYMQQADWQGSVCGEAWSPNVHTYDNATGEWDDVKVWEQISETIISASEETRYPTDDPVITPNSNTGYATLSSFAEVATKNGGEIKYLLSNDNGVTWRYHNGSIWTTSDGTYAQSDTASEVNTNIGTFPLGSGQFLFRAFLHSSGTQLVQLDTVTVNGNRVPNAPTLSSPSNGAEVSTVQPTLQLAATDDDSDALQYTVQLDTANTFNTVGLQTFTQASSQTGWSGQNAVGNTAYTSGTTASYALQSALTPGTTYYWRATATDPAGANTASISSTTFSFTTPAALAIVSPQVINISNTSAVATWVTNRSATGSVAYGTTNAYGATANEVGSATVHTVALTGLTPLTTYHYRITSTDATSQTAQTADATFTTTENSTEGDIPPIPTVLLPEQGSTITNAKPAIAGVAEATNDVFVILDGVLAGVVKSSNHPSGTGDFALRLATPLLPGLHNVAVRARSTAGFISEESGPYSFIVDPGFPAPTMGTPLLSYNGTARIRIPGVAYDNSTITPTVNGVDASSFTLGTHPTHAVAFTYDKSHLAPGVYSFEFRATGPNGKVSTTTNPITVTVEAVAAGREPVAADEATNYLVQEGDSLWGIAKLLLGDGRRWLEILTLNLSAFPSLGDSPNVIYPGWVLAIPAR